MRILILLTLWALIPLCNDAQSTFSKVISNYPLDPENAWAVAEVQDGHIMVSWGECLGQDVIICAVVSKLG